MKLSMKQFSGLPGTDEMQADAALVRQLIEMLAGELRPVVANECLRQGARNRRETGSGAPRPRERSASSPGDARVKSSTTVKTRSTRPSPKVADTKSIDQR